MSKQYEATDKDGVLHHGGEHKMGKKYGYETDGTNIWLAPTLLAQYGLIQDRERAIQSMVAAHNAAIVPMFEDVMRLSRDWWDAVYTDLDLDTDIAYSLNRLEGRIHPTNRSLEKPSDVEE